MDPAELDIDTDFERASNETNWLGRRALAFVKQAVGAIADSLVQSWGRVLIEFRPFEAIRDAIDGLGVAAAWAVRSTVRFERFEERMAEEEFWSFGAGWDRRRECEELFRGVKRTFEKKRGWVNRSQRWIALLAPAFAGAGAPWVTVSITAVMVAALLYLISLLIETNPLASSDESLPAILRRAMQKIAPLAGGGPPEIAGLVADL